MNKLLAGQVVKINRIPEDYMLSEMLTRSLLDISNEHIEFKDFRQAIVWFRSDSVKEFSYRHVMSRLYFKPSELERIENIIKAGNERYNRMLSEKPKKESFKKESQRES